MDIGKITHGRSVRITLPRHKDAPADDQFHSWCAAEAKERPLAIDLFSGAGGLGAGVEAAGWRVVASTDFDDRALETHRANFPGLALKTDMSDPKQVEDFIKLLEGVEIDLVVGGPPCQPFSTAGRAKIRSLVERGLRDAHDARKELWQSFVHVVLAVKPRAVIMENVPDMALGDDLFVIRKIANTLEKSGYIVDYRLLNAWQFGVPQHRKRFILQARRDGQEPIWPHPEKAEVTVRDAIYDLPLLKDSLGERETKYDAPPQSALARSLRGQETTLYDHMTRPVRDDDRKAFELMTSKTKYSDLPESLRRYRSDIFTDKYKRLDWNELSRSITAHIAKDGYWYIHPSEPRTLSVREVARIQTFPDSFRFSGTRSDAYRQIGNAVPPKLGQDIARHIHVSQKNLNTLNTFQTIKKIQIILEKWALEARAESWWLFPGPKITNLSAFIFAVLDIHRLNHRLSNDIAKLFIGEINKDTEYILKNLKDIKLSESRQHTIRKLEGMDLHESPPTELMTKSQINVYNLLLGNPVLPQGAHAARVTLEVFKDKLHNYGMKSDLKVAMAHLVGNDSCSSLRSAALRFIPLEELYR